jgi:phytoene dehydrogenase-like protein
MPMTSQFDAIVVGSGHNGLIAANYLSDAGKRVAVVERRGRVGGATVTEEVIPGFRASALSYVSGLLHPQILRDLGLNQFGDVSREASDKVDVTAGISDREFIDQ